MANLMLFLGFSNECTAPKLQKLITELFPDKHVLNLWIDPNRECRAVVHFENKLEVCELLKLTKFNMKGELIQPINNIFIRAYGTLKNAAKDKLNLMFPTKKFQYTIRRIDDDCFEVSFEKGWQTVLTICNKIWEIENTKWTVIPHFTCFQEPFDEQYKRLEMETIATMDEFESEQTSQDSDGLAIKSKDSCSEQLAMYTCEMSSADNTNKNNTLIINETEENVTSSDSTSTYIIYEQKIIPKILTFLNFQDILKQNKLNSLIEVIFKDNEVEIKGATSVKKKESASVMKRINKQLLEKTLKFTNSQVSKKFLESKEVQEQIKIFIENNGCHLVVNNVEDFYLTVVNNKGNQVSLQEFLSQIVFETNCLLLPNKDHAMRKDLLKYIDDFNSKVPYMQLVIDDCNIVLLTVLNKSEDTVIDVTRKIKKILFKKVKRTICNRNKFYIFLLDALKFVQAAEKVFPDSSIVIDIEALDIYVYGYIEQIDMIKKIINENAEQVPEDFYEDVLLGNKKVLHQMKAVVDLFGYHIVISPADSLKMIIKDKNGKQDSLENFAAKLVIKKATYAFKNQENLTTPCLEELVNNINAKFQSFHISAEERTLTLFAFLGYNEDEAKKINHMISTKNPTDINNCFNSSSITYDVQANCEPKIYVVDSQPDILTYTKTFLQNDILNLQKCATEKAVIVFGQYKIEIIYTCDIHLALIKEKIRDLLSKVLSRKKSVTFPGMKDFIESETGQQEIDFFSNKYECYIQFPGIKDEFSKFQEIGIARTDYSRLDYKSVILKTAKSNRVHFHLVQGIFRKMENLNMRIEFLPSKKDDECNFASQNSSKHLHFNLPDWKAPNCKSLRESLSTNVSIMFQQASHTHSFKIGISTSQISTSDYPFPLDVIAETIIEQTLIVLNTLTNEAKLSTQSSQKYDIFICESTSESVFKAFIYYLKKNNFHITQPDEDCWKEIVPLETNVSHRNYSKLQATVEVIESNQEHTNLRTLLCYPILPSLEANTCPYFNETPFSYKLLENVIKEIQSSNPDGLLIGQSFIKNTHSGKDLQIFCFPEWGMDCKEHIECSLRQCLMDSASYEAVHIFIPGVGPSKIPKDFLVQTVFNTLDKLIFVENLLQNRKKLALVVVNKVYRDAFKEELEKRCPKEVEKKKLTLLEKGFFKVKEWWSSEDGEVEPSASAEDIKIIRNNFPPTEVCILGTCEEKINEALNALTDKLSNLMAENEEVIELDGAEIKKFENSKNALTNLHVLITCTKRTVEKVSDKKDQNQAKKKKNKHKKRNKDKKSKKSNECKMKPEYEVKGTLSIQGLNRKVVQDFKNKFSVKSSSVDKHDPAVVSGVDDIEKGLQNMHFSDPANDPAKNAGAETAREKQKGGKQKLQSKEKCFCWKMEDKCEDDESDSRSRILFTNIPDDVEQKVEKAYSENTTYINIKDYDFNLSEMHVTVNKEKKGLIRSEIIDISNQIEVPSTWTSKEDEGCKLVRLDKTEKEFLDIEKQLKDLASVKNEDGLELKIEVVDVHRVQNFALYQRFKVKHGQISRRKNMWHFVSEQQTSLLVCEFGFHPLFCGVPAELNSLGKGVLFYKDLNKLLSNVSFKKDKSFFLFKVIVCLGESGQEPGTLTQHYTSNGDTFMVFSDAQAYPQYLIVLNAE
ncbi:uncharacterized protein LOC131956166 [Physella acuta]|uniref:uncharacterized protein LOC131956166 n=1 Tax=Physella acuta TaxID=109671 RepID=UPI0027DB2EE6|nr:uncharacterized protein LOC131956166 [Physella acuta]